MCTVGYVEAFNMMCDKKSVRVDLTPDIEKQYEGIKQERLFTIIHLYCKHMNKNCRLAAPVCSGPETKWVELSSF